MNSQISESSLQQFIYRICQEQRTEASSLFQQLLKSRSSALKQAELNNTKKKKTVAPPSEAHCNNHSIIQNNMFNA